MKDINLKKRSKKEEWFYSNNLLKRALSVWFHALIGGLIVYGGFVLFIVLLGALIN